MNGRPQVWALLGAVSCALACGNEAVPGGPGPGAGTAGVGTAGTNAGVSGAGGGGVATGGSSSGNGGSGGSVTAGSATGGASAGMGGAGGASGGSGGNAGSAGSGGSAGAGGSGSTLPKRVLLYHFSTYAIPSVPAQITLLKTQLTTWGYEVEDSVKPEDLSATNLARFGGVGMINTCFFPFGDGKMGETETAALKAFVAAGGGLFGTHCASVTFQSANPPHAYNALIGGRGGKDNFDGKSACTTTAEAHVSTAMLPATFEYTGNLDNADYVAPDSKVLVKCKWSGGTMKEHAVSWYRAGDTVGKGRVFFTNFAKVDGDISDATIGQKHILAGLGWTLGR
jgi:type 1 glutamine amidotransferase